MKLCSSQFDAYVEVFSKNSAANPSGGQTVTWATRGNVYAFIDERVASENLDRDGLETQRKIIFFMNYRTDIIETDRIEVDSRACNITSTLRVGKDGRSNYRGQFLRVDSDTSGWFSV